VLVRKSAAAIPGVNQVAKPPKPPKVVRKATQTAAPRTDVQSSGADYGTKNATAFKKTPVFKQTVAAVNRAQAPAVRSSTPLGVPGYPAPNIKQLAQAVSSPGHQAYVNRLMTADAKAWAAASRDPFVGADLLHAAAHAWSRLYNRGGGDTTKSGGSGGGATIGPIGGGPTGKAFEAIKANAEEAYHHPGSTVKGLVNQVTGAVGAAGDVALPVLDAGQQLVTGHPGRALDALGRAGQGGERLVKGMVKDYENRYGPLVAGDYKAYEKKVHQVGAAPGLTDIALAATGGSKLLRPATRAAVKLVPGGKAALEDARPALRTSGGEPTPQALSRKPTRALLQRAQDKVRVVANEGGHVPLTKRKVKIGPLPSRRADEQGLKPALQPVQASTVATRRPVEVVPVSKRLTAKAQRVAVSRASSDLYIKNRHEATTEVRKGADKAYAGLPKAQQPAAFHTLQGLIPVHGTKADIVAALKEHQAHLVANESPKAIPLLRPHTELSTVNHLIANADKVFTPKGLDALRAFHAGEVAREARVAEGSPVLRSATAEARRVRPQGERLGIPYKPVDQAGAEIKGAERDTYNRAYTAQVKKAAAAKGWPDPAYFLHKPLPLAKRSSETAGNLSKAIQGPKRSTMTLFNTGRAMTTHAAYREGLLNTIKAKHQISAVADVAHQHAYQWSLGPQGIGDTVHNLLLEAYRQGVRPDELTFVNFGAMHKTADGLGVAQTADQAAVNDALRSSVIKGSTAQGMADAGTLTPTRGFVAVPRGVGEELLKATKPSGKLNRIAGRAQGLQSAAILGLNPSWLPMQVAANTLQSTIGMHGNLLDYARGTSDYRALDPAHQAIVDKALGASLSEGHSNMAHLGYHQGRVAKAFEKAGQIPVVKFKGKAVRLTDLNPVNLTFAGDTLNNNFFRRNVFLNEIKRQQFRDLIGSVGLAQASLKQVSGLLDKTNRLEQLKAVLADPRRVEEAARYTDRVLGDYLRFTANERRFAKPTIMFYGFMRYATKTLFYTLPVHHPLAGAIALKLGQLHNEDIYKIFGTRNLPPWVLSRSYEYDNHGKLIVDTHGNPKYRDLARINPVTGPVTDAVTSGYKSLAGLISPLFQGAADLIAGETVQSGLPLRLHGSAEKSTPDLFSVTGLRVLLNREASSTFPGRVLMSSSGQTQGDDALPFSPRPVVYKTQAAQQRDAQRILARPTLGQQLFPLFEPRTDTTKQYLSTHGHGPTAQIDKQIKAGKAQLKLLAPGGRVPLDQYGYPVKAYADAAGRVRVLEQQRAQILKTPKRPVLKRRPLTTRAALIRSIERERNANVRQQLLDEVAREREQAKVNAGG
jgi:hypothetical protein